ncbi:MAG TPA: DUF362 domain-containing protein [Gemmataceae bacterium]|nr:DUF362 domain-containing protein [Gemmataceae bacterium]
MPHPDERRPLSRRGFLLGTAIGLGVGVPGGILCYRSLRKQLERSEAVVVAPGGHGGPDLLPGRHRGRVVEVHNPHAVNDQHQIDCTVVRRMLDRGMCEFTGADHPTEAWRTFFAPGEVIGIKVNPVGKPDKRNRPAAVGSISSPEVVLEVVRNLKQIGVKPRDIIVYERYASEFIDAEYEKLMGVREMDGVRWLASGAGYSDQQLAITGVDNPDAYSPELLRHVAGYDPDAFVHMGFAAKEHSQNDDRRFRSHLSTIVTRMVDKFITIPVLKDHRSAGVTLALKNLSHGHNNNVARSHLSGLAHGYPGSLGRGLDGPNQCNVFIPTAVNQPAIRRKSALHIMDGLVGVYEGGPGVWNKSWGTWHANRLFVATDPVAMDHVGWDIIDAKRVELGLPRVGEIGRRDFSSQRQAQMIASGLLPASALDGLTRVAAAEFVRGAGDTEVFDRRTPEHVILASLIGLGEFDLAKITHRRVNLL